MWNMGKKHKSGFYTRVCKQNENVEKKFILEWIPELKCA